MTFAAVLLLLAGGSTYAATRAITGRRLLLWLAVAAAMSFAIVPPCLAENITYPSTGAVIIMTNAPYNCKGDGVTDCTAAIQKAMNDYTGHNVILYFPDGTYLVSASLVWANHDTGGVQAWGNTFIQGQSKAGTIIKLKNNTFTNPGSPAAIMSCQGFGSADWFANYVQNITFNAGTGNTGAIGLRFYSNNTGAMRDVNIISEDGQGVAGLDLSADMNGPLLVKNLVVQGFQTGIKCGSSVNSQTFEHLYLTNQTVCAFVNGGQNLAVRDLNVSCAAPAVQTSGGLLSLVDANLTRTSGSGTAISCANGFLHVRNLTTSGYTQAITCTGGNNPGATGPNVTEFFSHNPTSPFPSPTASLNLPIQETPDVAWDDPSTWANVNSFGADPTGNSDSSAAIQAAIDSGATTIWFPGVYKANSPVYVRGDVYRLISAAQGINYGSVATSFIVTDGSSPTVVIQQFRALGTAQINTTRNVVISSCGPIQVNQLNRWGNLYIEDACPSTLSLQGNVWARQLNPEAEGTKIINDAGTLWVLGLKTERSGTLVETRDGGNSEILGNFSYTTTHQTPGAMFVNSNASMFTEFTEICYSGQPFDYIIQETRGTNTITVPRANGWVAPYIGWTNNPPAANFSASPTSNNAPLTVQFGDLSTWSQSPLSSWSWNFGDGGTSTNQNPSYQYTNAGTYTVSLTVTNVYGSSSRTNTNYITVTTNPPVANFSASPTNGNVPLTVQFTDLSTASGSSLTAWSWDFGDGRTSTSQNPSHQYTNTGTYTVSLTVTDVYGSGSMTNADYITVISLPPAANFSASATRGNAPLTVQFTDLSTPDPTFWSWTFGDGGTSTSQNPIHQYTNAGTYTVSLTVTNPYGGSSMTNANYINVTSNLYGASIGVEFYGAWGVGGGISSTASAGVLAQTNWYKINLGSITGTNTTAALTDNKGNQTAVKFSYESDDGWQVGSGTSTPDYVLMKTYLACKSKIPQTIKLGFTNVPAGSYDVFIYGDVVNSPPYSTNQVTVSGTPVIKYWMQMSSFNGTYTEVTSTASNNPTLGNYVHFTGVSPDINGNIAINVWDMNNWNNGYQEPGVTAVQLVSAGSFVPPVANFSGSPTNGNAPLTVQFTNSSTGSPTFWSWTFGDGGTSTSQNPSHQYTDAGTYTVSLTVTNGYGSSSKTNANYITVTTNPPVANFSGSPTNGNAPLTVQFTDLSTASGSSLTSWSWNFGDGGTSTTQNPSHQYTNAGTYTVALTVTSVYGSGSKTNANYITVTTNPPVANFSGTPTSGAVPLTVNFTDTSSNTPTSWSWNFGDGGTSSAQNPSHQYTATGTYTVTLAVANAYGSNTNTKANYITVTVPGVPTFAGAGAIANSSSAITPALPSNLATNDILLLFVETANQAITIPTTNGGTWTEVANSPQGYGTAAGSTATRLTVFWSRYNGTQGNPTTSDSGDHQQGRILAFRGCVTSGNPWDVTAGSTDSGATISGSIPGATTTVSNCLVVAAIASSLPDATSTTNFSAWANADLSSVTEQTDNTVTSGNGGGLGTATGGKAVAGTYGSTTVTLANASTKAMMSIALTPGAGGSAPVADFSGTPTSGAAPLTVNFTDASTGSRTSWLWTFGDGGTSTNQNPSHQYTNAGPYTVALTVTNSAGGNTNTKASYIVVTNPPPTADFSGTPTNGAAPLTVNFTDASTGSPTYWSWTFGDGGTSTAQNPSHQYMSAGTYTVALTVTNSSGGNTNTKSGYITVTAAPPPTADFSGTPTNGTVPLTVNFTDASTGSPTAWSWTFGDGGTSTAQNPSHQYTNAGTYTVALTVTNSSGGNTNSKSAYITVTALLLNVGLTTTNTVMVSWPWPSAGWNLQQNDDLGTTNWVTPLETVNNDGTNNFIIVNSPTGTLFYRLSKPLP